MKRTRLARNKKKIVILGGGFAGVECAKQLESQFGDDPETLPRGNYDKISIAIITVF